MDTQVISDHMSRSLKTLGELRRKEQLLDFEICVGNKKLMAHKLVLAANSDYFLAMFAHNSIELDKSKVLLQNIDANSVESIVNFFYTCQIDLNNENIEEILLAASILQVQAVQELCIRFIEVRIDATNCLGVALLSERCNLPVLQAKAVAYCLEHFKLVIKEKEFLQLDDAMLSRLLSDDKLNIEDEVEVFDAVINWTKVDEDQRKDKLSKVLSVVRFALMDPFILVGLTNNDLIQSLPECRNLIDSAKHYLLLKDHPKFQEQDCFELSQKLGQLNIKPRESFKRLQRLYAVGGWTDEFKSIASAEVYNPNTDTWVDIPPMAQKRCGVGLTTLNDSIYAVGGHDGLDYLSSVERFDVNDRLWFKDVANMKYVRTSVGVVTMDGYIYAIGGQMNSGATDKTERYDITTNTWTTCAPMIQRRLGVGVAVLNGFIYVMGGSMAGSTYSSVERYDPKKDLWVDVESMTVARKHLASCTCQGKIYAVGGRSHLGELDTAEVYDPYDNKWTAITPMHIKRSGMGLVELAGCIYAIGGQNQETRLKEVEAYDPETGLWTWKRPMRHGRLGGGVTVHPLRKL